MAGRIRTIKPETLSDPKAARLSDAAWRLWVSSWTLADDEGRLPADPAWLSSQVFWVDRRDCSPIVAELVASGLVRSYSVNGDPYIEIAGWKKPESRNERFHDGREAGIDLELLNEEGNLFSCCEECNHDTGKLSINPKLWIRLMLFRNRKACQ